LALEVESVEKPSSDLEKFLVAKILKTEPHPDADRLKVCDVDIGNQNILKVVCGAPNAREGLITIYAPPGAVIPKNKMKLVVAKIRGVTSHGMLCSESELNLSEDSEGITELDKKTMQIKLVKTFSQKVQQI
jgi:phenylalanyl-tRNA synthetase beta chain